MNARLERIQSDSEFKIFPKQLQLGTMYGALYDVVK